MERNIAWAAAFAAATVGGSLAAACLIPFVALAVMAAGTLPRREGVATVVLAWAANQAIGFALLGYPLDAATIGWGFALGAGALAAFVVAASIVARLQGVVALFGGAVAAFAAYELVLYAYGLAGGGTAAFTPSIVWLLARNEALWLAGLFAAQQIVIRLAPGSAPLRRAAG